MLANKLKISNQAELEDAEERIGKKAAKSLFEAEHIDKNEIGTYSSLAKIHHALFNEIYDFAGRKRTVDLAKKIRCLPLLCI